MPFERASTGQVRLPAKTILATHFLNDTQNRVPVPVAVDKHFFLFDVESRVKTFLEDDASDKVLGILSHLLSYLKKAVSIAGPEQIRQLMESEGMFERIDSENESDRRAIEALPALLFNEMTRVLREQSGGAILLQDVLKSQVKDIATEVSDTSDSLDPFSFASVLLGVQASQRLHSMMAQRKPLTEIVSEIQTMIGATKLYSTTSALLKSLHADDAPRVSMKEFFVMNQLRASFSASQKPFVERKDKFEFLIQEVTDVPGFVDADYPSLLVTYISMLRAFMGVFDDTENATISAEDLVKEALKKDHTLLPFVPQILESSAKTIAEDLFSTIYQYAYFRRVTRNEIGEFRTRILSVMQETRYKKGESWETALTEMAESLSVILYSYLDTAAVIKSLADNPALYTEGVSLDLKTRAGKVVFDYLGQFNSFQTNAEHPSFMREPAIMVNHKFVIAGAIPDFECLLNGEEARQSTTRYVHKGEWLDAFKNTLVAGQEVFAPVTDEEYEMLNVVPEEPDSIVFTALSSLPVTLFDARLAMSDKGAIYLSVQKFKKQSRIPYFNILTKMGTIQPVSTKFHFRSLLGLPDSVADLAYEGPGFYLFLPESLHHSVLYWNPSLLPVYEVVEGESHMLSRKHYKFVAKYPYFMTRMLQQRRLRAEELSALGLSSPKPSGPPKKKKGGAKPDEDPGESGDGSDGSGDGEE